MEQEIEAKVLITKEDVAEYFPHELEEELQKKLTNENTEIKVVETYTQNYSLYVRGSIKASWKLKLNHKTAQYINDHMLQGLEIEPWQITMQMIKEEAAIYANK
jgi:predicted transcriptional regulator